MRIAQIVLSSASQYERKAQRADLEALPDRHQIVPLADAQIAHVYAGESLSPKEVAGLDIPYVSSAPVATSRWSFRPVKPPAVVIRPIGEGAIPEAVESAYWGPLIERRLEGKTIGSFHRPGTEIMVDQTLRRIHRFRDDVIWNVIDHVPTREDLIGVDVWVDPASSETDADGFVAEALVVGLPVVAARTPLNSVRLEQGRSGWLVPPRDPNEMTHAILAALFKPEVAENKLAAARQTHSKFKPRQRMRVLGPLYDTLTP